MLSAPAVNHVKEQRPTMPSQAKIIFSAPIVNGVNEQRTPGQVSSLFLENKTTTKIKDECHQGEPLTLKVKSSSGGTLRQKATDCGKIKCAIYPKEFKSKQELSHTHTSASLNPHINDNSGPKANLSKTSHAPTAQSRVTAYVSTVPLHQNKNNYNDHSYSRSLGEYRFESMSELPLDKEIKQSMETVSTNVRLDRPQNAPWSSILLGKDKFKCTSARPNLNLENSGQKITMSEEPDSNNESHESGFPNGVECLAKLQIYAINGQESKQSILNIKCKICGVKCENLSEYFGHLKVHSTDSIRSYHESALISVEDRSIIPFEKPCPSIFRFKCSVCKETFATRGGLRKHTKEVEHIFVCQHCPETFQTKSAFIKHIHTHPFKSVVNDKTFSISSKLENYMTTHGENCLFSCSYCDKKFQLKQELKQHALIHMDAGKFKCSICGKTFGHSGHLKDHIATHSDERPFSCLQCEKSFKLKRQLNSHMIIHTDPDRFRCTVCGRSFDCSSHLKDHMVSHSQEYPFSCQYCAKKFKLKRQLAAHTIIHTDPDRFRCSVCDKIFCLSYLLKAHMATHSDYRAFSCPKCKKSLKTKSYLVAHMKICKGIKRAGHHDGEIIKRLKREEIRKAPFNKSKNQSKGVRLGKATSNKFQSCNEGNIFSHNSLSQCLMCLSWFKGFELKKHMYRCQVKRPCLNRIVEVKIEVKGEIQTEVDQDIKREFLQEIIMDFDEGTKPEINHAIKTEIKVEPTMF